MNYALFTVDTMVLMATVGIAVWQHRVLGRYRQADRQSQAERAEQEKLRQMRRDRRDSWEPAFRDADETLRKLEDIESEVRAQGPIDRNFVDRTGLKRIQWRLENVADRCPETLRDPLHAVATGVVRLRNVTFPSNADVVDAYTEVLTGTPPGEVPRRVMASELGARAVEQYRAAADLHEAIVTAWKAIHMERGGEP